MTIAVFPGSFDPLTNGHVDIAERSLALFDEVVIAVLENPNKQMFLSVEDRVTVIRKVFSRFKKRVRVDSFSGLLVDFMRESKAHVIVRGLRAISDYDYEAQMALLNKSLASEVETIFLVAREENSYISSTAVKQVAQFGGDIVKFVPAPVAKLVRTKTK